MLRSQICNQKLQSYAVSLFPHFNNVSDQSEPGTSGVQSLARQSSLESAPQTQATMSCESACPSLAHHHHGCLGRWSDLIATCHSPLKNKIKIPAVP